MKLFRKKNFKQKKTKKIKDELALRINCIYHNNFLQIHYMMELMDNDKTPSNLEFTDILQDSNSSIYDTTTKGDSVRLHMNSNRINPIAMEELIKHKSPDISLYVFKIDNINLEKTKGVFELLKTIFNNRTFGRAYLDDIFSISMCSMIFTGSYTEMENLYLYLSDKTNQDDTIQLYNIIKLKLEQTLPNINNGKLYNYYEGLDNNIRLNYSLIEKNAIAYFDCYDYSSIGLSDQHAMIIIKTNNKLFYKIISLKEIIDNENNCPFYFGTGDNGRMFKAEYDKLLEKLHCSNLPKYEQMYNDESVYDNIDEIIE